MYQNLKNIFLILSQKEKVKALYIILLIIFRGFLDFSSLASIGPFLLSLSLNEKNIKSHETMFWFFREFNFVTINSFQKSVAVFSIILVLFAAIFRVYSDYCTRAFLQTVGHNLRLRILKKTIAQPYSFFFNENSSKITTTLLAETDVVVVYAVSPFIEIFSNFIIAFCIISFLLYLNPVFVSILLTFFLLMYIIVFRLVRSKIHNYGQRLAKANAKKFKFANEIFGGIKELKVLGRTNAYLENFSQNSVEIARVDVRCNVLSNFPRHLIELLFMIFLISGVVIFHGKGDLSLLFSSLTFYVAAAYRLLPLVQNIYHRIASVQYGSICLENVLKYISLSHNNFSNTCGCKEKIARLELNKSLAVENLTFSYSQDLPNVIDCLNFNLPAKSSLGILGETGSGKSTLVDLILGLIESSNGAVKVDGVELSDKNCNAWRKNIGYVPQHIFLADDTILKNIAFGLAEEEVNEEAVFKAAKMAQIFSFVNSLPNKFDTKIGERGIKLSGGQRQRIGLARALYHDPEILILDEATSALDNETEAKVMKSIEAILGQKTIIMIAHRLTTIENCEYWLILKQGKKPVFKKKLISDI
jgi:ABC-type multidrug transport system fused ATPase/permease subunit